MALYGENALEASIEWCQNLVKIFRKKFTEEDVTLFSSPGRTEISGNHTNHNHGKVLAGRRTGNPAKTRPRIQNHRFRLHEPGFRSPPLSTFLGEAQQYSGLTAIAGLVDTSLYKG